MNVTLKLTTDFEDIPEEVSYMLKKVGTELSSLRQTVHDVSDNALEQQEEALQSIHSCSTTYGKDRCENGRLSINLRRLPSLFRKPTGVGTTSPRCCPNRRK